MLEELVGFWPAIEEQVQASIEARVKDRLQYLSNTLDRRRDKEIEDMTKILTELQTTIQSQLEDPQQMALFQAAEDSWTAKEQEQLRRNLDSLAQRIAAIPTEIERETELIRRRYSDPTERTFPVALTFLVPESMAAL